MTKKQYSIDEAAAVAQVTPAWIRAAIRGRQLKSALVPIHEGALTKKHLISESALQEFMSRENQHTPRREDKRGKWIMYATPEEVKLIKELLYSTHDVHLEVVASTITPNAAKARYLEQELK